MATARIMPKKSAIEPSAQLVLPFDSVRFDFRFCWPRSRIRGFTRIIRSTGAFRYVSGIFPRLGMCHVSIFVNISTVLELSGPGRFLECVCTRCAIGADPKPHCSCGLSYPAVAVELGPYTSSPNGSMVLSSRSDSANHDVGQRSDRR